MLRLMSKLSLRAEAIRNPTLVGVDSPSHSSKNPFELVSSSSDPRNRTLRRVKLKLNSHRPIGPTVVRAIFESSSL